MKTVSLPEFLSLMKIFLKFIIFTLYFYALK